MMRKSYPFYLKSTVILVGLICLSFILLTLKGILVPLSFGLLLAILLNPLVNRLKKWKLPHALSISIALVISIVILAGVGYFISMQIAGFSDQLPAFKTKSAEMLSKFQHWLSHEYNITIRKQDQMLTEAEASVKTVAAQALMTVAGSLELVLLIPLYAFLFLYYKTLVLNFLYEVFDEKNSKEVGLVLTQTKGAIQSYMFGLCIEALIVAALNSTALLILGVQYAILLGILGAILNVLPFIGGILSVLLPLIIATITKDGLSTQLWIIIIYMTIQFIDNHFLVPYIVSSKVKINALISILIVLLGGAIWGVSGMFLSIPFIGILKIIFDRIPETKPWGKLLGDEVPTKSKVAEWAKRKRIPKADS